MFGGFCRRVVSFLSEVSFSFLFSIGPRERARVPPPVFAPSYCTRQQPCPRQAGPALPAPAPRPPGSPWPHLRRVLWTNVNQPIKLSHRGNLVTQSGRWIGLINCSICSPVWDFFCWLRFDSRREDGPLPSSPNPAIRLSTHGLQHLPLLKDGAYIRERELASRLCSRP